MLLGYKKIEFVQFNLNEAILFIKNTPSNLKKVFENQCKSNEVKATILQQLKPYTRHNPYLLKVALQEDTLSEARATCLVKTTEFIKQTLPDENDQLRNNSAKEIAVFLHHAEERSWVNTVEYRASFMHQRYLSYIVHEDKDRRQAKIETNFPLLPRILKQYLHDIMKKITNRADIICQYPAVKGYLLEIDFFACLHFLVAIANAKQDPIFVTFTNYCVEHVDTVIDSMAKNTLYHLRNDHPIIDGVGLLQNLGGEMWLVFVQVSIQCYDQHSSSLQNLFQNKKGKGYQELTGDFSSMFDYYQNLANLAVKEVDCPHILYL